MYYRAAFFFARADRLRPALAPRALWLPAELVDDGLPVCGPGCAWWAPLWGRWIGTDVLMGIIAGFGEGVKGGSGGTTDDGRWTTQSARWSPARPAESQGRLRCYRFRGGVRQDRQLVGARRKTKDRKRATIDRELLQAGYSVWSPGNHVLLSLPGPGGQPAEA